MFTRYTYKSTASGGTLANVVADVCAILCGETNPANLSSACVPASTEILATTPAGWTNAAGGGGHRSSGNARSIANDADLTVRDAALHAWGDKPAMVFGALLKPFPNGTCHVLIYAKPPDAGIMGARAGRRKDAEAICMVGPWPTGIGGKSSIIGTHRRVAGPTGVGLEAGHPHAKPLDVLSELIGMTTGTIADPFMGSGSTLRAAKDLGRKAIGIEIEERYCEIAAKRLAQEVLFT
jgi:site-specific DNA-methyltransferase (adenine-specific)